MGAYDEAEHERRERKNNTVDLSDDTRAEYEGSVEYDSGDSAEALLETFRELQGD
jgi:hypothetical protein